MTYFVANRPTAYAGVYPPETDSYLDRVHTALSQSHPADIARRIVEVVRRHDRWRIRECLNLMAPENTSSVGSRRLMSSYMGTRATEGFPAVKEWPAKVNLFVDEVEATLCSLCRRLFGARFVEWRLSSTTMANAVAFFAHTRVGDSILVQAMSGGGNMNYHDEAIPRLRGLRVLSMPFGDNIEIDVAAVQEITRRERPRFLVVGGSKALFPFPIQDLRKVADEVGALLLYDAAHVSTFIAAGRFQDPLSEGAHVLTTGTHKVLGGPIGGLAMMTDENVAKPMIDLTFPAFVQTVDQARYAATAYALAEMTAFGAAYADAMVRNARALAGALEEQGFDVVASERQYTATHQILLRLDPSEVEEAERRAQDANILFHKTMIPIDGRAEVFNGARISVQEPTRQGMGPDEMRKASELIRRAVRDKEGATSLMAEVAALVRPHAGVAFSFDDDLAGVGLDRPLVGPEGWEARP